MESSPQHLQLRLAAEAARATLAQLQSDYAGLTRRIAAISESMQLLQGVIDAWDRINPERDSLGRQLVRIDQELRAANAREIAPGSGRQPASWARNASASWPAKGEIGERVHRVLAPGTPLSPSEAHAAIDARFHAAYSLGSVSLALRHGAEAGRYVYNGQTGKYRIAGL